MYERKVVRYYYNRVYIFYFYDIKDIADMDFVDDLPNDSEEERFRKHNRFLRTLKEDTLLIIDNFNATAIQDSLLSVVLFNCLQMSLRNWQMVNYYLKRIETTI